MVCHGMCKRCGKNRRYSYCRLFSMVSWHWYMKNLDRQRKVLNGTRKALDTRKKIHSEASVIYRTTGFLVQQLIKQKRKNEGY